MWDDMLITREYGESQYRVSIERGGIETRYDGLSSVQTANGWMCGLPVGTRPDDAVSTVLFKGDLPRAAVSDLLSGRGSMLLLGGDGTDVNAALGMQVQTVAGAQIRTVVLDGKVVGYAYADADAEYCTLTGVLPEDTERDRGWQAESCFLRMERALKQVGMEFCHVVRTWLYLAALLEWYDEFNGVRNAFFEKRGILNGVIPASTGIGASNYVGAAIAANLYAVKPKHPGVRVAAVPSPLQCPAPNYRSAFSRAVEIAFPDRCELLISGTASIDSDGTSLYAGDMDRQIKRTMDVIEAILQSRQMGWGDITRGIVYVHAEGDMSRFIELCRKWHIPRMPLIAADHVTVCREELLFEIEIDAIRDVGTD